MATIRKTIQTSTQTLFNMNTSNITKLTSTDYLMWSFQIHVLLDGYDLTGFLDKSTVAPDITLIVKEAIVVNPDYAAWKKQDKLSFSTLLGAISPSIQPVVSRATTSAQIWHTLAFTYAKPSRAHIKQVRNQMKLWTKGTRTIDEYFQSFTVWIDQFAILGKFLTLKIRLNSFLRDFLKIINRSLIKLRKMNAPLSLTELRERLLNHEIKLLAATPPSHLPFSANVAYNTNNNNVRNTQRHINNPKQYNNTNQQSNWNDSNQR